MRLANICLFTASAVAALGSPDGRSLALVRRLAEREKLAQQVTKGYPADFRKQHPDVQIEPGDPDYPYVDGEPVQRDVEKLPEWAKRNAESLQEAQRMARIYVHDCWMRYIKHRRTIVREPAADTSGLSQRDRSHASICQDEAAHVYQIARRHLPTPRWLTGEEMGSTASRRQTNVAPSQGGNGAAADNADGKDNAVKMESSTGIANSPGLKSFFGQMWSEFQQRRDGHESSPVVAPAQRGFALPIRGRFRGAPI